MISSRAAYRYCYISHLDYLPTFKTPEASDLKEVACPPAMVAANLAEDT